MVGETGRGYWLTLCVPTLNRTNRLRRLLESADGRVDEVIVADNGRLTDDKSCLYGADFDFKLNILSLDFDVGVGTCRAEAFEKSDGADYVIAADDDHALTRDLMPLVEQLEADPTIGGIAGNIVEPEEGRVWQSAKDFREVKRGDYLLRTAAFGKDMEMVAGHPLVKFDFIPYPTIYRRACLEDYSWDRAYPLARTHADFYVGHWKQTDWRFGINPEVAFRHYPGGDDEYTDHRRDEDKIDRAKEYFREKWGYEGLLGDTNNTYWFASDD